MKFTGLCLLSVMLVSSLNFVAGHSYHLDERPDFEPMAGFEMEKFLGTWYAVQTTSTSRPCMMYEFTGGNAQELTNTNCINCTNCVSCVNCRDCVNCRSCTNCTNCKDSTSCTDCNNCRSCTSCTNSHNCTNCKYDTRGVNCDGCTSCTDCTNCKQCTSCTDCKNCTNCRSCTNCTNLSNCTSCTNCTVCPQYKMKQISQNSAAKTNIYYQYVGLLKPDLSVPSKMSVSNLPSVAGKSPFVVFATDYVNYACVYSFQKKPSGHKYSVTILSRTKILDKMYLDKMHKLIASSGMSPYTLSFVDQLNCNAVNENFNVESNDQEPINGKKNKNSVTEVGDNMGQSVENVINDDKNVYISVKSNLVDDIYAEAYNI